MTVELRPRRCLRQPDTVRARGAHPLPSLLLGNEPSLISACIFDGKNNEKVTFLRV